MPLEVGDSAPNFNILYDNAMTDFHSLPGLKIVYFFPRAFTPGCTRESCSIRDVYDELKANGITEVIGISIDGSDKQQKFKEKYELPFPLISDQDKQISRAYKVYKNYIITSFSKRVTFLVDESNTIVSVNDLGVRGNNTKYGISEYGKELLDIIKIDTSS